MTNQLIVKDEILINASPASVWEVLITPEYVAQWDELPENYPDEPMKEGDKVIWELPDGNQSISTVIEAQKLNELVVDLHLTSWEIQPKEGEVAYRYRLESRNGSTLLKIEIGDFSLIKDGQKYYDASVEFADEAKKTIKRLAENP